MWSSFYRSRKRALLIWTGPMIGVLFRHDWTLLWLSLIQSLSHKSENPEVCWSPERRELNQTTEILLLIYSFCCVDFICNQLSWKSDSDCLIRTTNIVRGNKEAAENTWSPCFKSHHTSCRVIKLTLAWEEAAGPDGQPRLSHRWAVTSPGRWWWRARWCRVMKTQNSPRHFMHPEQRGSGTNEGGVSQSCGDDETFPRSQSVNMDISILAGSGSVT